MTKLLMSLIVVVVSLSACSDPATSNTIDSSRKVPDSTQMILDSTKKIDSIQTH